MTKYSNNQDVRAGDVVELSSRQLAEVVADIGGGRYSEDYTKDDWGYLATGVLVLCPGAGIVHMEQEVVDYELTLISRGLDTERRRSDASETPRT